MKTRSIMPWKISLWIAGIISLVLVFVASCTCGPYDHTLRTDPIPPGTYVVNLSSTDLGRAEFGGVKDLIVDVQEGGAVELRYTAADGRSVVATYAMGKLVRDGPFYGSDGGGLGTGGGIYDPYLYSGDIDASYTSDASDATDGAGDTPDPGGTPVCEGAGCFGDPCAENMDCQSGICISHMGEFQCTSMCLANCPEGWECKQILPGGGDILFVCVSKFMHLCKPCMSDEQCVMGEIQDICADYGEKGAFCGTACAGKEDCPEGFQCTNIPHVGGGESTRCVQSDLTCACSAASIKQGLSTYCSVTNEFGTCDGARLCTESGLGTCDAAEPAQDICNGADDNCDGTTDEVACEGATPCFLALCKAKDGCVLEPNEGAPCDDDDANTKDDTCDAEGICKGK